jgi:hypothetical protein
MSALIRLLVRIYDWLNPPYGSHSARSHDHRWLPWPGRPGYQYCPDCPAWTGNPMTTSQLREAEPWNEMASGAARAAVPGRHARTWPRSQTRETEALEIDPDLVRRFYRDFQPPPVVFPGYVP